MVLSILPRQAPEIDFRQLETEGYTILPSLVTQDEIGAFEETITRLVISQVDALGLAPEHADPFIDVFGVGGKFTDRFYHLLERLYVLQQISTSVGFKLRASGLFEWSQIRIPLLWHDIRADIPGDSDRMLPVHQDYASTFCEKAWRLWIPLRPSNEVTGSMRAYAGTHKHGPIEHNTGNPLKPFVEEKYYRDSRSIVFDLPAGHGVLINPLILHASVPNQSDRTKFTLMIQVQDFATMTNPAASGSRLGLLERISSARAEARAITT